MFKVLLRQNIPALGKKGEIIKVKPGFARNYLIPQRKASIACEDDIKRYQQEQEQKLKEAEVYSIRLEDVKNQLSKKRISIKRKATSTGTLYAALTKEEMLAAIYNTYGVKVEEELIQCPTIKSLGIHNFKILLKDKGTIPMKVKVAPIT